MLFFLYYFSNSKKRLIFTAVKRDISFTSNHQTMKHILTITAFALLLSGCGSSAYELSLKEKELALKEKELELKAQEMAINVTKSWVGTYGYTQNEGERTAGGTSVMVEETLTVTPNGNGYKWRYEVAGWQVGYVLNGEAIAKGDELAFYLFNQEDGGYSQFDLIDKSQPFFKLKKEKNTLFTLWLQPDAQKAYHVYFENR